MSASAIPLSEPAAFAVTNAGQLVCVAGPGERVRLGPALATPLIREDAALIARRGVIDWVGPAAELPPLPPDTEVIDAAGRAVLPGLVDSHTHLLFAGTREDEF